MRLRRDRFKKQRKPLGKQVRESDFWHPGIGLMSIPLRHRKARLTYFQQFDILKRGFKAKRTVCVLAPGKNAAEENSYRDISANFIIAVNAAALIPLPNNRKPDMWLVTDNECTNTDWFHEINKSFHGIRCFSTNVCAVFLPIPFECDLKRFYTVTMYGKAELDGRTFIPMEGIFRPDLTVSGTAARIAQLCGTYRIQLCGVDMIGNHYWNGKERNLPQYTNKPFDSRDRLDSAIRYMRGKGMEIYSLSDSALEEV